ncbi:CaiF/GrlA family transcriptional regulator [Salmonella enterica]|nr:CaiF/GrlA family transcriptional regulator [Salmonella enterica]EIE7938945.1 CaiF/GrlA family transcriptional regulator [Salmonella enterica]
MCPDDTFEKKTCITPGNDIYYPDQKNHDDCFIPESVRQYNDEPLYLIVAHWCQQQQDWVQHKQISEAFHITSRRASFLIACLSSKTSRVVSVCRHKTLPSKVRCYEIYVIRVLDRPTPARHVKIGPPPVSKHRGGKDDKAMANERWNRLCSTSKAGKILKEQEEKDET